MSKEFVERVLSKMNETDNIAEIIGLEPKDYRKMIDKFRPELKEIISTGKYTLASLKLLQWLGFSDDEINVEKLVKSMLVVKNIVFLTNRLAEVKRLVTKKKRSSNN